MLSLDSLTFLYVRALLRKHKGNVTAIARVMKVDRRTVYRWIDRWERESPPRPAVRGSRVLAEYAARDLETFEDLSDR